MRNRALLLRLSALAILLTAAAVRLPTVTAARPYLNYVDEGHVLHHAVHLLGHRTWDPAYYVYPSLPMYAVAGAALAWSPFHELVHGRPLRQDLSPDPPRYYDLVEPWELIAAGRLVTLLLGLGIVVLTGLLVRRLAGPAAGLFAAWLAALVPALVIRGGIVNVDPYAAFFTLAALLAAEGAREGPRPRLHAALAGALAGLAAVSKYPAAVVCLPVALAVLLAREPWPERLRRLVLAGAGAVAAAVLAMPSLVLRTREVLAAVSMQSGVYSRDRLGSYWDQAVRRAEWDLPFDHPELGLVFLILTAAGLAVALRDRRWRRSAAGWLLFSAVLGLLLSQYSFRVLRNLLALVPIACVLAALLYARLREALQRPRLLDLAAFLLPLLLWAPGLYQYARSQLDRTDTREEALAWLAANTTPKDRVLFVEEVVFLPSRTASLKAQVEVHPWERARALMRKRRVHYVAVGNLLEEDDRPRIRPLVVRRISQDYQVVARFGNHPTYWHPGAARGNQQTVYVLKRKPREKGGPGD